MNSLINLVQEFAELDRQLVESGGVITPEMESALALNGENMQAKVDKYYFYCQNLEARAAFFKGISEQAIAAKRMFEGRHQQLRENLKHAMKAMGTDELKGGEWRYKMSKLKPKVVIHSEQDLPQSFWKKVESMEPDKEEIAKALLLGESVPGAHLEEVESLRSYVNHEAKPTKELK